MKRFILPAVGGLLLAAAAFPPEAASQDDANRGQQNSAATAPQPERNASDNPNAQSETNRDQNRSAQTNTNQNHNHQNSADQNRNDEDEIEYRGMEHAALGVLLSERNGNNAGVRIREILPQSPANRAGLRAGDQITQIDGKQMKTYGDVVRFMNRVEPGQQAAFVIRRDNQDRNVNVTFASQEEVWGDNPQFAGDPNQHYSGQQSREYGQQQQYSRGGNHGFDNDHAYSGNRGREYTENYNRQYSSGSNRDYGNHDWQGSNQYGNSNDRMAQNADQPQRRYSYQNQQSNEYGEREYGHQATLGVGLESERGVPIIRQVQPNSPAAQAGLQPGDEIIAVDNQQVRNHSDLLNVLSQYQPGDRVNVIIQQDGRNHTMRVRLAAASNNRQPGWPGEDNYERQGFRTGGSRIEGVQPDGFRRDGFRADRKIDEER